VSGRQVAGRSNDLALSCRAVGASALRLVEAAAAPRDICGAHSARWRSDRAAAALALADRREAPALPAPALC
jgi:hypothetical protein